MTDTELRRRMQEVTLDDYPSITNYTKAGELGLWILWIAKNGLGVNRLTVVQIVTLLREVYEISLDASSVVNSFNRFGRKIHKHSELGIHLYEIMKSGRDYLKSKDISDVRLYRFSPDTDFKSKYILANEILNDLNGDLKIVDPYCGDKTLDIISNIDSRNIKFLTCLDRLNKNRDKVNRSIIDFLKQTPSVEFRDYKNKDIHDRYIISDSELILLGHGIKDLGSKESFAIVFNRKSATNVYESLVEAFNRRWKNSTAIK